MSRYSGVILGQLDRVFNQGTVAGLDDDKLLKRFVVERDEVAFAALVARHGRMVLGVCRRILHDEHDVEDAFQATFLVLVSRESDPRRRSPGSLDLRGRPPGRRPGSGQRRSALRPRAELDGGPSRGRAAVLRGRTARAAGGSR